MVDEVDIGKRVYLYIYGSHLTAGGGSQRRVYAVVVRRVGRVAALGKRRMIHAVLLNLLFGQMFGGGEIGGVAANIYLQGKKISST